MLFRSKAGLIDEGENVIEFKYKIYRLYYKEHCSDERKNKEVTNKDMGGANEPERA